MSLPPPLGLEAQTLFNDLLCQYARTAAHEASNLLFLEDIAANTGRANPNDRKAGLAFVRRQARVIAQALAPDAKPRATKVSDLCHDLVEAITRQTSLSNALDWSFAPEAASLQLRERPGHAQLLLQHLIEEAARRAIGGAQRPHGALVRIVLTGDDDGIEVALTPLSDQPLPEPSPLAQELCAANAFGLAHEHAGAAIRVWLPVADRA